MTKPKTAILWGPDDLLAQALEILLTNEETWEVIRISSSQPVSSLVEQVQKARPTIVILCQGKCGDESDPLMKLLQEGSELKVIADRPESKVIVVSLHNNVVQVYSKHSIMVRKVSDLVSVIEDSQYSKNPT